MLQIKPILEMRNGKIESVEKVRTKRKAIERENARDAPHVAAFRTWLTREFEQGPRRQT